MWSISSNQEQYVGRARIYDNEDRTVYLASGYPVEQMIKEEDEEITGIGKIIGLWYNRCVSIIYAPIIYVQKSYIKYLKTPY